MAASSSPPPWLTTHECSASFIQSSNIIHWFRFIFLSPCPQRVLFSSIDLLFLLTLIVLAATKLWSRFTSKPNSTTSVNQPLLGSHENHDGFTVNLWFKLTLLLTALLTITCTVICVVAFTQGVGSSPWGMIEAMFWLSQAVTYAAIVVLLTHEKKFEAVVHPLSLRVYWVANFIVVALLSASAITRLITRGFDSEEKMMKIDDIYSLVSLPISAFLFVVAIKGSSGVIAVKESKLDGGSRNTENVTGYATASLFSRGIYLWMNPLLTKGYKTPLDMDDVPSLSPAHKAERMAELFERNWPKPGETVKNPLLSTLLKCFWKDIVFIGFLAILRLAVMYIGPMLIQSFIDVTSGNGSSPYEGYLLILVLLVAKIIEALSSHQYNFQSQKLGMLIRSSLITSLFKKGLRLSNSSRQDHGVGQIVNYMSVDCQQLADMMLQLHPIWMMPFQVGIALVLLYGYLGVAAFVSLVAVVLCFIFSLWITQRNNKFMFNVMMSRDSRMKATNELISNMRVIKFQAWEEHFNKRIYNFRETEYSWLSKFMYSICSNAILLGSLPVVITAISFGVALLFGVNLDAATVFTATTIFKIVQEPIMTFPQALITISQALVSLKRVNGYMTSREIVRGFADSEEHMYDDGSQIAVEVVNGSFSWDDEGNEKVLEDVNFGVRKGELVAIVGTVGSGKSSLLASVLGEMHKNSGKVRVCGSTAYVSQTSWIQNATIQENILFGSPLNTKRYKEVIRVCCLEKDLEMMEHGDQTEIGERGINLSGGQKQRIQLARAVYQDSDIYLLDDVFSAVDAHTGSEIFKECVRGVLKNKTVLLVTHQLDFLHNANLILVMRKGRIVQSGRYEELLEHGTDFGALVAAHETSMELVEMSSNNSKENSKKSPKSPHSSSIQEEPTGENESLERSDSKKGNSKLIEDEEKETGHVSLTVYKQYSIEAFGWFGVFAVLFLSLLWQGSLTTADYWLAYETSADRSFNPSLFINVYWIIVAISCLMLVFRSLLTTAIGLVAAQSFFKQILHSMIHAPMSFFDTTPSGRILSRASTDQANVDFLIPMYFNIALVMYFSVLGIVFVTCLNAWPTIFLILPLAWLNVWYREYYLTTSRELTRLDSITKAPVIHHFSETVSGVMTICCFRKQDHFVRGNIERVNLNLRMDFHNNAANEWLGFRLEMIGSFILCVATMFMVLLPGAVISPEYVGLTLSYGLPLNVVLFTAVYMSCFVENKMVSVERIKQFINIPSEAPWRIEKSLPSQEWPTRGDIEIKDLKVRYRPNTPLVLKGITLSIRGGEKTGVVGRTGSGKSTLIQVFFRLVEPSGGAIIIDGVNICNLGLHDLRSRFGIIPQDPVLFQGTIRSNIDPVGLYTDEEIWKSLERCQLKDVVASKPEKLYASVTDTGDNWSVGQRQLLCLGRVMLKHSRILFMDEATASVDSQTDTLIQRIIREDFSACTIITIAHRIPTVIDCDRVLVMDDGLAKEFDSPTNLMERPTLFAALVQEYANRSTGV